MEMQKNIKNIVNKNLCTGCGTCVALCPMEALRLDVDHHKGIYTPYVIENKCIDCTLCSKVCPGGGIDFHNFNYKIYKKLPEDYLYGNYINNYFGYSLNENTRYHSSSGGLVTSILLFALKEGLIDGALITRMNNQDPLKPLSFIARTRDEIIDASGSKYCPVPANTALKDIINSKKGERFAVVGLPCHIQGIRKACELNSELHDKIAFNLGLFCAKAISFLGNEFLFDKLKIDMTKIQKISYRGKGWPGKMTIESVDSDYTFDYKSYYKYFNFFEPWRCTLCFDPTCTLSDISLGDAWLPEIIERDKLGTSVIISRTELGDRILNQMAEKNEIELIETEISEIKKSQNNFTARIRGVRARFYINELLGNEVPSDYYDKSISPTYPDVVKNCIYYIFNRLALNKNMWFFIRAFHRIR